MSTPKKRSTELLRRIKHHLESHRAWERLEMHAKAWKLPAHVIAHCRRKKVKSWGFAQRVAEEVEREARS